MKIKNILLSFLFIFISTVCFSQEISLVKISGDKQLGIRGIGLKNSFVVQLLDSDKNSLKNVKINFSVVETSNLSNNKNSSYIQISNNVLTDDNGYASAKLIVGKKAEDKITVIVNADVFCDPIYFTVSVLNKNWMLIMLAGILGGAALLLFGMFKINLSFQKMAGQNIRVILTKFTSTRFKGFLTGLGITCLNQSSTATLLLQITLASAGVLTFFQSMSVSVGASVGSTITGQLVAFKLVDYALIIIAVGYFLSFFSTKKRIADLGDAIFGFGLLFFGMKIMSDAMLPITLNNELLELVASVKSPIFSILVGLFFTMLIQSSGATVGIVIVLASAGILSLTQGICICLGAQIGTCITAVVASINQPRSGKNVMLWHLSYQIFGVLLILPFISFIHYHGESAWIYFVKFFTGKIILSTDIAREIAMSHTLVTLFAAMIILPIIPLFYKLILFIFPSTSCQERFGPVFIDQKYIKEPDKAFELSKQEISRLSEIVLEILKESINALKTRHEIVAEKTTYKSLQVTNLANRIVPYITKVGQNQLTTKQSQNEIALLYIVADFEQISDIIDRNLIYISHEKIKRHLRFSDEGLSDIKYLHNIIYTNCSKIIDAFVNDDIAVAHEISTSVDKLHAIVHKLKKKHISRLHADLKESIETSGLHMDVLDQYTRINDILSDIAINIMDK
ncbi:MAG: Na/Pi cotransporter family protein [Endomicrobiaceae bacterium]|nr:Na/Pi cotransporter family protein [Endomicrobiaceae bacterium]MDD3053194.1 Na/Pi cotransporter family protein [Endomicrobiaceae bacterium]MDD3922033.1 Na/Pi cotransporter family protein [Endomicrobiaceae bacterium]